MSATRAAKPPADPVLLARRTLLEGVGAEVAASFPGITRLGGQIVAALYLAEGARSMDELSAELGRSKSNIFANLRGLAAAGIVEHHRDAGARHDRYRLRGKYPDVVIGAYVARLRRVVSDKRSLVRRSRAILGDARGPEATALRAQARRAGRNLRPLRGALRDAPRHGRPARPRGGHRRASRAARSTHSWP